MKQLGKKAMENYYIIIELIKTIRQIVGSNVKLIRKHKGLSQAQLAELSLLSTNKIRDIENCSGSIGLDTLIKVAVGLEVKATDLLTQGLKAQSIAYNSTDYKNLCVTSIPNVHCRFRKGEEGRCILIKLSNLL